MSGFRFNVLMKSFNEKELVLHEAPYTIGAKPIVATRIRFLAPCVRYIQGDSSVFHCASLLRTIFALSARAHECVQVLNLRDFPQAKLNSKINARFL